MRGGTQRQAARGEPQQQAAKPFSWELYFGSDAWQADDRRHLLITDLVGFFASPPGWQLLTAAAAPWHARLVVELDWQELLAGTAATDLATAMQMQPGAALGCLACAAYEVGAGCSTPQACRGALRRHTDAAGCPPTSLQRLSGFKLPSAPPWTMSVPCRCCSTCMQRRHRRNCRPSSSRGRWWCGWSTTRKAVVSFRRSAQVPAAAAAVLHRLYSPCCWLTAPSIANCRVLPTAVCHLLAFLVAQIKADAIGKLVSVCGTVVRATAPTPVVTDMEFVCGKCGEATRAAFPDGRYTPPEGCPTHGCRGRVLTPQQSSAACIDWQRISLQVGRAAGPALWALARCQPESSDCSPSTRPSCPANLL